MKVIKLSNSYIGIIVLTLMLLCSRSAFGYDDTITHPEITKRAISASNLDAYLKKKYMSQFVSGISATVNGTSVRALLTQGSTAEDKEPCRRSNHFHNPINPNWQFAGLDELPSWMCDSWHPLNLGQAYSALTWATGYITKPPLNPTSLTADGLKAGFSHDPIKQSKNWDKARDYYFKALTLPSSSDREIYFAKTFQTVGQVLHLLQDMGVPAHVRNDFLNSHIYTGLANPYELYVQTHPEMISLLTDTQIRKASPQYVNSVTGAPSFVNVVVTDYWDSNVTPDVINDADLQGKAGLSEYTNANYVSEATLFKSNTFNYPSSASTITIAYDIPDPFNPGTTVKRAYFYKTSNWETDYHLAGVSYTFFYAPGSIGPDIIIWPLDETVHRDYAERILPHVVGYSASLINYFFRGDILLGYKTDGTPGYVVINNSPEGMDGLFSLYYDQANGERIELGNGEFTLAHSAQSDLFDFIPPNNAKEPGKNILVFKGKLGNEENAVAASVFKRILDVTLPESGVYALVNADQNPLQFTQIKAKVRNTVTDEAILNGTIQAIAKYKNNVDDMRFVYAVSTSQTIAGLGSATEFTFDFTGHPIPINATDLYLQVIFKGQMGDDENATAIGTKDISEPTPIDLFNNMDRICLRNFFTGDNQSLWYIAGSDEALSQVWDGENRVWDVFPHTAKEVYLKISSSASPQIASSMNYDYHIADLDMNTFKRTMYILADSTFSYSYHYYNARLLTGPSDPWSHYYNEGVLAGTAVKHQTYMVNDAASCDGDPPCYETIIPVYYPYRGSSMWWGGGLIFINAPFPEDAVCADEHY